MKLNEKLISLRKERGLSQLKLAEKIGVSRQAISRWEAGIVVPSTENLQLLSELYHVPIDYLVNEKCERTAPDEEGNRANRKSRKWVIWLLGVLIVVTVTVVIGVVAAYESPEMVDFSVVESENWNNTSTDDIPIKW